MLIEHSYLYFDDVVQALEQSYTLQGKPGNVKVNKISTLEDADEYSLVWIKPTTADKLKIIRETRAGTIICDPSVIPDEEILAHKTIINVPEPKHALISIINRYFKKRYEARIDQSAIIHNNAKIADDVYIGANTYIGTAEIGKGVIIEGNCFIYDNTVIRDNVIIQAGAVIGSDGFGHFKKETGELVHFPHIGRVVIASDVHIGSNTVIDRGVLGDTYIGKGTKINKMCVISHNVRTGSHNFIAHSVCINGSVRIGDNSFIGSGAIIKNKVIIGNDAIVGMGAVVVGNVTDGQMVYGNPAQIVERKPNKSLF